MSVDKDPDATGQRPSGRGGPRTRRRSLAADGGGRFSRPLAAALIVIIAGAAYLFWPRGGVAPQGLGEQLTVITADSSTVAQPRSGSVDIEDARQPVVAEQPTGATTDAAAAPTVPPATSAAPRAGTTTSTAPPPETAGPAPRARDDAGPAPATGAIRPRQTGSWAVQVGAYGNEANADNLATRLAGQGIAAQVRAASTPSGDLIYRVWIGWFESRDQAKAYAEQEKSLIGEAHPVHR